MNKVFFAFILGLSLSLNAMIKKNEQNIYNFFGLKKELVEILPNEMKLEIVKHLNPKAWWYNAFTLTYDKRLDGAVFNKRADRILILLNDKKAQLCDLTGNLIATFKHNKRVRAATFNWQGDRILTSDNGTAKLWDLNGNLITTFKYGAPAESIVFNRKGDRVLTISSIYDTPSSDTAKLWNLDGKCLSTFNNVTEQNESKPKLDRTDSLDSIESPEFIKSALFNNSLDCQGERILTISSNSNTAKLWDRNGHLIAILEHNDCVELAVFNKRGDKVLTSSDDGTVKLWDRDGNLITTLKNDDYLRSAVFNKTGDRILTNSYNTVKLWNMDGECLTTFNNAVAQNESKRWNKMERYESVSDDCVNLAVLNQKGDRVLISLDYDDTAKLLDLNDNLIAIFRHGEEIRSASFITGDRILTTSDETVKIWDLTGNLIATFNAGYHYSSAVFKQDKVLIALLELGDPGRLDLWNLYKNPTFDQVLLKKLISLYLTSKKTSKNITTIENFLRSISLEFNLNYKELELIWKSLPKDVSRALWLSIEQFVGKFGLEKKSKVKKRLIEKFRIDKKIRSIVKR